MSLTFQIASAAGVGGGFGSNPRCYAVDYVYQMELGNFSFGILFVNIFGSFLIGILYAYFSTHDVSTILKAFLIAGFLGGLTTFSTFALDSYLLFNSSLNYAILNILSNLIGSIFFVLIGFKLAIFFIK